MRRKSQITAIEMIISVTVLFIAFNIMFPNISIKSRWEEASLLLQGRDILLAMERTGKINDYAFSSIAFQDFASLVKWSNIILWSETESTVKSRVAVACNCTNDQISYLSSWAEGLKLNNREIKLDICHTDLEDKINPCFARLEHPDVLIIWGYKNDLSKDKYIKLLSDFLGKGNGIVEIADIKNPDNMQKQIFGLGPCQSPCGWGNENEHSFTKPNAVTDLIYQPYKYFYTIPVPITTPTVASSIPIEGTTLPCSDLNIKSGSFVFRGNTYTFWTCGSTSAYFDTDNNGKADYIVNPRSSFKLNNYNFFLSYINDKNIAISFRPDFKFTDFLKPSNSKLLQIDNDASKIFLSMGTYANSDKIIPVSVVNSTAAWVVDFSRNGLDKVEDDQKNLLLSLILWSSSKTPKELSYGNIKIGHVTSYLNVMNYDMFEMYKFNLGVGYPF